MMDRSCSLCGSVHLERNRSEAETQTTRLTQRLSELEAVRAGNALLKTQLEGNASEHFSQLSHQKAKYIALLQRKELLQQRAHQLKKNARNNEQPDALRVLVQTAEANATAKQFHVNAFTSAVTCLEQDLNERVKQLNIYRVNAVLAIFKMMDLDAQLPERKVNRDDAQKTNGAEDGKPVELLLTGCSSILSIPVPNSGNYSGTPVDVVTTAVAHIAHMVDGLSAALNIPLSHPLLPFEASDCDCMVSAQQDLVARAQVKDCRYSLAPAVFMNERTRFQEFDWTTLNELPIVPPQPEVEKPPGLVLPTVPSTALPKAAFDQQVVVNSGPGGEVREYAVNANFPAALVLLQANVISLCLKAGLSAESLWPAEAMLLNLHVLKRHCEQVVARNTAFLAGHQDVLLVTPQTQPVLTSLTDRYGSLAALSKLSRTESMVLLDGSGSPVRADFSPERSGLARDGEWDIIHMS